MKYSFQNLLHLKDEKTISGPMSPFLFAQEFAKQQDMEVHGLCRVWFDDVEMLNRYEGRGKAKNTELTGLDHLILKWKNGYFFVIDEGTRAVPVALFFDGEDDCVITPIYDKMNYEKKLERHHILNIFREAISGKHFELKLREQPKA